MTAWQVIGLMIGAVVLIYLVGQFMREPGVALMNLLRGVIVGLVALFLVNFAGQYFGFHIGLNPFTALTAGLLGLPGVAALVVIQIWLV
ncbi:pro-sigmaK processing inhibitor BofA family protein [Tumebacillus permanentifrigoris]|uniref:Inhibitor of the pro-sigma K processing machinery n=1 Tax=Tumebacillus permanentifrigoris TaxID=378543 RepID=A0A316DPX2_9BACL|nr:pro-sigmaK processing inhibitor BofA family protein [Tumebacillus permanentifrigoris]PWK05159.1 inhibitor of the pro-sigma K processing machinery [Tumebacillus permanentifrigoris]